MFGKMYAKAALATISVLVLDAQATWEDKPNRSWEDKPEWGNLTEWDKAEWNTTDGPRGEWNWTKPGCQNRTGRDREDREAWSREDREAWSREDREDREEPESISGGMELMVGNASAFVADLEAKEVVRGVLADLASVDEEFIVALSLTAAAGNRSRRLTAAPEEGAVTVRYEIRGEMDGRESSRIAAALKSAPDGEVARACRAHLQAAGLPYTVSRARFTSVSVNEPEERPCEESEQSEGRGHLRGSHRRGNCGPPALRSGDADKEGRNFDLRLVIGISAVAGSILALCVGVIACCRRVTKPQGPKVMVIEGLPHTGSPAKTPAPAQGVVVDNNSEDNNNNNTNGIVMGSVVPEAHEEGRPSYL